MTRRWCLTMLASLIAGFALAAAAEAQVYSRAELAKDEVRLRNAVIKIYEIGIKPSLTEAEKKAIGDFEFRFPYPKGNDELMNFYATTDGRSLIMPIMSLKALEDLATAYGWTYNQPGLSLSTIDVYYTMLRYRDPKPPAILKALHIPDDALKDPRVDDLSLRLRNEAFAFIIIHELGHIRFKHKPVNAISAQQAQKDESEADRFALDVLARTKTPALGAALFFQAQIYNLEHRSEFASEEAFKKHMQETMSHPLSVERIKEMAAYMEGPLARGRPTEAVIWQGTGMQLRQVVAVLEDVDLARCVVRYAKTAELSVLKPRQKVDEAGMLAKCRS
ncbi:MAG TPA: hypothetical protein VH858_15655 [Hyphomicrobiales bacterium]